MSDVNFDKYPSCLSWQVLNKNSGRMADRTRSILYSLKINCNKVNNNFFLSLSKVCASLICSGGLSVKGVYVLWGKCPGGKCPGGICPRGYMS